MKTNKTKNKNSNFNYINLMFSIVVGLAMLCTILLMSNHLNAIPTVNHKAIVPQVYDAMEGETEMGVSYETVYVGSTKYIVFKYSDDIEVVRAN